LKIIKGYTNTESIEYLFGFFYWQIESGENYLGLQPYRSKQGFIYPLASCKKRGGG